MEQWEAEATQQALGMVARMTKTIETNIERPFSDYAYDDLKVLSGKDGRIGVGYMTASNRALGLLKHFDPRPLALHGVGLIEALREAGAVDRFYFDDPELYEVAVRLVAAIVDAMETGVQEVKVMDIAGNATNLNMAGFGVLTVCLELLSEVSGQPVVEVAQEMSLSVAADMEG
jgi:hypothetical protein